MKVLANYACFMAVWVVGMLLGRFVFSIEPTVPEAVFIVIVYASADAAGKWGYRIETKRSSE